MIFPYHENTKIRKLRLALPLVGLALLATACPQKPDDNTGFLLLLGASSLPGTGTGTGSTACTVPTAGTGGCTSHPVCASTNAQTLGTVYASCNYTGSCTDFGAGYDSSSVSGCSGGGTFSIGTPCPTANRIATAAFTFSGKAWAFHVYSPNTAADARTSFDSLMASPTPGTTCTYSEP